MNESDDSMSTRNVQIDTATIIAAKRLNLQKRQGKMPFGAVVALADMQKRSSNILNVVTTGRPVALIGQITHTDTYDPVAAALRYIRSGMDGVSLFTDGRVYTQGMNDLLLVARGVRNSPVISQDYVLNEYHVTEARAAGASALVLYSYALERADLRRVVSLTMRWHMTAIVQVSNADELAYAARLSPHVIGVGIDQQFIRERDIPLMEHLRPLVPYNTKFMPLGCIKTLDDALDAIELGAEALIIDETLLKSPRAFEQLRAVVDQRAES